jgi:hypothetical protein
MYGMKRAEGRKGRVERAEGCKISGRSAMPLYFGLAGTLFICKSEILKFVLSWWSFWISD